MERNPQSLDQISWGLDDQSSSHVRSYTCAFCKRGFSNAQALGGHMNIHRKDRARLKQASDDENLLSLDITKTNPVLDDIPEISEDKNLSSQHQLEYSSEDKSCTTVSKEPTPKGKENVEELHQQLPLFMEMPSPSDERNTGLYALGIEEKNLQASQNSLMSQIEPDLELRLGPEPHETSTKKIF